MNRRVNRTRRQRGGNASKCGPNQHWMPPKNGQSGYCMEGKTHTSGRNSMKRNKYRAGGNTKGRLKRQLGSNRIKGRSTRTAVNPRNRGRLLSDQPDHTHTVAPHVHNIGINSPESDGGPFGLDPWGEYTTHTGYPSSQPDNFGTSYNQNPNYSGLNTGTAGAHGPHGEGYQYAPGDFNQDGVVDVLDAVGIMGHILDPSGAPGFNRGGRVRRQGGGGNHFTLPKPWSNENR